MFTVALRTILDRKAGLIAFCMASLLFLFMYVAMYPTIEDQAEDFAAMMENYPEGLFEALGVSSISFDTIEQFLALEQFSIVWPLMVMFLVLGLAGSSIAGAIERGTIENILAKPISRSTLFGGYYLAGVVTLLIFTLVSTYGVIPLALMTGLDFAGEAYRHIFVISYMFGLAVMSLGFFFSSFFSERSKVFMSAGGILLLMYIVNIASSLIDSLEFLQYFSFFYYYDFNGALIDLTTNMTGILVFAGVSVVCTALGLLWFNKRDIAI